MAALVAGCASASKEAAAYSGGRRGSGLPFSDKHTGKNGGAVLHSRFSPLQNVFSLLHDHFSPLHSHFSTLQNDFSLLHDHFSPVQRVFARLHTLFPLLLAQPGNLIAKILPLPSALSTLIVP
jgi:hypothetical protein